MPIQQTKGLYVKKLLFAVAALSLLVSSIPASAGSHCTTTCSGYGNTRTCSTNCW